MKYPVIAATAAIALMAQTPAAFAQAAGSGANGAQYGDPNNAKAEGSQNTNGALSGQTPGAITDSSSETHSYNGADLDQNINGAMSLQSNGSLNNESNLSSNPSSTP